MIKILLYGGLRASELLGLKFDDVEYLQKHEVYKIKVLGKGNKERYTYIDSYKIQKEIIFLLSKKKDYVAETKPGKVMDRKNLWSMVLSFYQKSGVDKKRGVHILRHTFAQSLVEGNVNLSTIQDLLGHANIQTTMIYARTNEKNKIEAIKNTD
jgi:integrase/recombinase XerD